MGNNHFLEKETIHDVAPIKRKKLIQVRIQLDICNFF